MLSRQNAGRRHKCRGAICQRRRQTSNGGNQSFAATDIALQQAAHRNRLRHIVYYFADRFCLRRRWRKWQMGV